MAYLDQSRRPSPGSMMAVIGVHTAMAAALVMGLTVSGVIVPPDGPTSTWDVKDPPPPPPPEETVDPKSSETAQPEIYVPTPRLDIKEPAESVKTSDIILPPLPPRPQPGTGTDIRPLPTPAIDFTPVAAKPRNDPGRWLTDSDYKSIWIRKEMVGTARFRLEIAANGKVAGCAITGSTGHSELDAATCSLVSKRARFEPARGGEGQPVAGSYSSSVRWVLPE